MKHWQTKITGISLRFAELKGCFCQDSSSFLPSKDINIHKIFLQDERSYSLIDPFVSLKGQLHSFTVTNTKEHKNWSTCPYCDATALRAVAHEVGGNDVSRVVGAALQAVDPTGQFDGVTVVNEAIAVSRHGHIENWTAGQIPAHCDGACSTFLHCNHILGSARSWKRRIKMRI